LLSLQQKMNAKGDRMFPADSQGNTTSGLEDTNSSIVWERLLMPDHLTKLALDACGGSKPRKQSVRLAFADL
jgi:hypothetical protein